MYSSFRTDPDYLARYHLTSFLALSIMSLSLYMVAPPHFSMLAIALPGIWLFSSTQFSQVLLGFAYFLALTAWKEQISWLSLPFAILAGCTMFTASSMIHNASHGNFKPRWMNRILGEATGLFQLAGFPDWSIVHTLHHAHPDDPERDPHPPQQKGYWKYTFGMRDDILRVILKEYFSHFGKTPTSHSKIRKLSLFSRANQFAKVGFWYLLLPLEAFTFFFALSVVFKMMHYPWLNWVTHINDNGTYRILDVENGAFYKIANFLGAGIYHHKSHHENPKLFDPRKVESKAAVKAA